MMKQIFKKIFLKYKRNSILKSTKKDQFINDRNLLSYRYELTKKERKDIKEFFKPFFKLDKQDFLLLGYYKNKLGFYKNTYIPDYYFYTDIKAYLNNQEKGENFDNKAYYIKMFPELKQPVTVLCRYGNSKFFDSQYRIISKNKLKLIFEKEKLYIFKPSILTSGGKGIFIFKGRCWEEYVDVFEKTSDFVVQEVIKQDKNLSLLSKKSVNTFRIYSLYWNGETKILGSCIRFGSGDDIVDNFCHGGCFVPINEKGELQEWGITHKREKVYSNNGVSFKGIIIPNFKNLLDLVKREAYLLPDIKFIGWDFALDDAGDFVFIELNMTQSDPELLHFVTNGDLFGKDTQDILAKTYAK